MKISRGLALLETWPRYWHVFSRPRLTLNVFHIDNNLTTCPGPHGAPRGSCGLKAPWIFSTCGRNVTVSIMILHYSYYHKNKTPLTSHRIGSVTWLACPAFINWNAFAKCHTALFEATRTVLDCHSWIKTYLSLLTQEISYRRRCQYLVQSQTTKKVRIIFHLFRPWVQKRGQALFHRRLIADRGIRGGYHTPSWTITALLLHQPLPRWSTQALGRLYLP